MAVIPGLDHSQVDGVWVPTSKLGVYVPKEGKGALGIATLNPGMTKKTIEAIKSKPGFIFMGTVRTLKSVRLAPFSFWQLDIKTPESYKKFLSENSYGFKELKVRRRTGQPILLAYVEGDEQAEMQSKVLRELLSGV